MDNLGGVATECAIVAYATCDMGRMQRTKGASGEREAAKALGMVGLRVARMARNGVPGAEDLRGEHLVVEVKRRNHIPVLRWLQQAIDASDPVTDLPLLMMREDLGPWIMCVRLTDLDLLICQLEQHRVAAMNDI